MKTYTCDICLKPFEKGMKEGQGSFAFNVDGKTTLGIDLNIVSRVYFSENSTSRDFCFACLGNELLFQAAGTA